MRVRTCIAFGILFAAGPALAAAPGDFTCANRNAQITCDAKACAIETDAFTPMSVSREGGQLEVCAYSGCWKGPLDLIRTRGDLTVLHARLGDGKGQASVTYDRKQKVATLLWSNFAQALSCGGGA